MSWIGSSSSSESFRDDVLNPVIVSSSEESKSLCLMERKLVRDLTDGAFLLCHDRADRDLCECADCDLDLGDLPDNGRAWIVVPGPV